ncbi:hypothetical protein M5K25_005925 [Dendrobium thyrsiflorum]|uniref:Uncharacterized protein n=1 Tax=Dendrobium thyrsiflorum TaxID=117978 RepID=A0ABD0VAA3_DENTH
MAERKMGFRFNAQNHCPPNSHVGQQKPELEPVKKPSSHENSTINGGGRRFGFPSSMFQRGDKNAWPDPTVISEGGWVRPSPTGWTLPPDEPLEPAVKNQNAYTSADNIRRSPAFPAAGGGSMFGRGSGQAAFPAMKKATALENIDSNEAAKKYGGRFMF